MANTTSKTSNTIQIIQKIQLSDLDIHELIDITELPDIGSVLNTYMGKRDISTAALFERAGLNRTYGFRVMNGQRIPSRDVLLRLAFVLQLDIEQTQYLLKCAEEAPLSGRRQRDIVLLKLLHEKVDLMDAEDLLVELDLEPLMSK